ncbi:MAG TPA: citrate synthase [Sphingopyxis sp.]|uniref:citrate synthase n=1 Tax=Sphingopyxis sp. TaxID=1908224 RepID=UPI002CE60973|nr:citrate synthase [Sphingopyxis sp.]HWW57544.1 citrate synthase [Sphingopyxis sp.]
MEDDYISAEEAAGILGVSRATIYAYVSRKGIRSRPVPGTRQHRYRRVDVEQIKARSGRSAASGGIEIASRITTIGDDEIFYRGRSAAELSDSATFEQVAARLWDVDASVFDRPAPRGSPLFERLDTLLAAEAGVDRAIAHFPFLEQANPRGYDLSHAGMAATGVDIVRWLTAIILNKREASADPVHLQFERALALQPEQTELLRRVLILAADHGVNENTYAVRMVARAGVTPWRSVSVGLALAVGRQSKFGQNESLRRFIGEILAAPDPEVVVTRQIKENQELPGFGSPIYPDGDPRAAALVTFCDHALSDRAEYRKLRRAIELAHEFGGLRPNFAFVSTFAEALTGLQTRREFVGLSSSEAPYLIGRSAGWVAHCIEQVASDGHFADSGD